MSEIDYLPPTQDGAQLQSLQKLIVETTSLVQMIHESLGAQRLPGSGTFAFRRVTDPLILPVGPQPSKFVVPEGFFAEGGPGYQATTFLVVNANACYVRLRGTTAGPYQAVSPTTGWLFPPGFVGCFTTQHPIFMSTMAVPMPGFPLPAEYVPLELPYGGGT